MKKLLIVIGVALLLVSAMLFNTSAANAAKPGPTKTPTPAATKTPAPVTPTPVTPTAIAPTATPGSPTATPNPSNPHASITSYDGPQTCIACHASEAQSMLTSEHMQWEGKWKEVNTYCTAPEPADFACRSCHVSTGKVTGLTVNDIDCLICHNDTYKRALGPQTNVVNVTDWTGATKTYNFPVKTNGDYRFQPRYDLMPAGTTMVSLAQTVHLPTKTTCLNCHAKAGGGDGVKRGDIYMNLASASLTVSEDVHMSPAGGNLTCQDCHIPSNHLIPGKGIDLRISEGGTVTCQQCHSDAPHATADINKHTAHVACQTCHIPTFGKNTPTEMSRDWTNPHWNPGGCNGQGAWIGEEVKASNVIPTYTFWNGTSDTYNFGETINPQPNGTYSLAKALGSIQDGKLTPIKVHTSYQPMHAPTKRIVQYDVLWNFMTGKYEEAATRGISFMGLTGSPTWVATSADQLITHGVEPKANALQCAACHGSTSRMNLKSLGYQLKGPTSAVCTQCHAEKRVPAFDRMHNNHVGNRGKDCSYCHAFSRPERGLAIDPTP